MTCYTNSGVLSVFLSLIIAATFLSCGDDEESPDPSGNLPKIKFELVSWDHLEREEIDDYEAPASFIASPIFDREGERTGVLIFQMPVDRINELMARDSGIGKTGETLLVGNDLIQRCDSGRIPCWMLTNASRRRAVCGPV